jgi:formylmethanofuran dehydrogenase subunit C
MITLTLKSPLAVPLEAEAISPDGFATASRAEIGALPVHYGRRAARMDELFEVDGEASDEILVRGDVSRVKWIGRGMTRGRLRIEGNAGMHLGAFMQGGTIEVIGDVSDWLGAEMRGGEIHVQGNAGGQVGAAYRGAQRGMRGGVIRVDGAAGPEVGMKMRRGLIAIGGAVGDYAGLQMKGGTICLLGGAGERVGAWMTRGTIISLASVSPLPTFSHCCDATPTVLRVIARKLAAMGITLPCDEQAGVYRQYAGDFTSPGRGELFIWKPRVA